MNRGYRVLTHNQIATTSISITIRINSQYEFVNQGFFELITNKSLIRCNNLNHDYFGSHGFPSATDGFTALVTCRSCRVVDPRFWTV